MVEHASTCCNQERFASIEADLAELKARMDSKRDDIHSINTELSRDRQQQTELLEKVTTVTVLLKQGQDQRVANNDKLTALENKIDKLQEELTNNKEDVIALTSSLNSFKNTVIVLIPIVSIIVGVILHFIYFLLNKRVLLGKNI